MTKDVLVEAIRHFDFFPSVAKLVEFFDEQRYLPPKDKQYGKAIPVQHWPYRPEGLLRTESAWWQTNSRWPGDRS